MSSKNLALLSVLVNFILALAKFVVGILIASVSLIAEGIHSALDVFSSAIAYLGIAQLDKEEDEKYPYGRYRFESIAAFVIVIFLAGSALWILWESYQSFLDPQTVEFSTIGIVVMAASIVFNEIMARYKFKVGGEESSLALVADAEHDRADVISSAGVLIGLFIIPYFAYADAIIAGLVGIYIIYESIELARETIDSLVDVADPEIEKEIKKIANKNDLKIENIKTRKIGAFSFAEIEIDLPANIKLQRATEISKDFEDKLVLGIKNLKQVVVSAKSHDIRSSSINQRFGFGRYRQDGIGRRRKAREEELDLPKKDTGVTRIISSIRKPGDLAHFGSKYFSVKDIKEGKEIFKKKIVLNPFWTNDSSRSARFVKAAKADKVITNEIGPGAKENLEASGIEIEIEDS